MPTANFFTTDPPSGSTLKPNVPLDHTDG